MNTLRIITWLWSSLQLPTGCFTLSQLIVLSDSLLHFKTSLGQTRLLMIIPHEKKKHNKNIADLDFQSFGLSLYT